jgi:hypothetical protein
VPRNLPSGATRLFAHYQSPESLADTAPETVLARLMEEGDSEDLRWLTTVYTESQIARWLTRHGSRQLSRRSESFWSLVLDLPLTSDRGTAQELWPL